MNSVFDAFLPCPTCLSNHIDEKMSKSKSTLTPVTWDVMPVSGALSVDKEHDQFDELAMMKINILQQKCTFATNTV